MRYLYSKEQIDKAVKRIKRFRCCEVYLSDHFANGLSTAIEDEVGWMVKNFRYKVLSSK